jgi:hypothetical protein
MLLVAASKEFDSDLFRYDLVDITKEVLRFKFGSIYTQLMLAYNQSDLYGVGYVGKRLLFFVFQIN